jgi:methylated-DNA-[protein]-cysteine S-methyltransferase
VSRSIISSPIGPLLLETTPLGIQELSFLESEAARPTRRHRKAIEDGAGDDLALAAEVEKQIGEYFAAGRRRFDLPLDLAGTEFQRRVWTVIASIPFGETASYAEVAGLAGFPNAYRAAGSACASNPVVIVVPCHRVVGSDRGLHGFGGGLDTKAWLLRHEGSLAALKKSSSTELQQVLV